MKLCSFDGRNRNLPTALCTARRAVGHPSGESVRGKLGRIISSNANMVRYTTDWHTEQKGYRNIV